MVWRQSLRLVGHPFEIESARWRLILTTVNPATYTPGGGS